MYGNAFSNYPGPYGYDDEGDDDPGILGLPVRAFVREVYRPVRVVRPVATTTITRDSVWTTYQGERVRVRDMTDSHLFSAAAYLKARKWKQEWRRAFLDELQRRVLGTPPEGLDVEDLDGLVEQMLADTAELSRGFYHDTMTEARHGVVDPPRR